MSDKHAVMRFVRRPAGLLLLAVLVTVVPACSDSYVGEAESAAVVIHESTPCNVALTKEGSERHGLDWYSKATVHASDKLPGTYEGTLTYTGDREAVFDSDGIIVRFEGKEPDALVSMECGIGSEVWNPTEGP